VTNFVVNQFAQPQVATEEFVSPLSFHQRLPEYHPSRLVELPQTAKNLGVGGVWIKDESSRMGLPSFKILGASWATYRALEKLAGGGFEDWSTTEELGEQVRAKTSIRKLSAATDGNHGRAVARVARWLGLESIIFVPKGTVSARIEAIEGEGAEVVVVDGTYDEAVARSAEEANEECIVVSDTSWEGYTEIPGWVIDGYSTIFQEAAEQFHESSTFYPDVVVVQMGVGALAASVVRYHRGQGGPGAKILGVEPDTAACVLASIEAGEPVSVPGPHPSIIAGLNCDTPSMIAWPQLKTGIDAFVAISDEAAKEGMRELAQQQVVSGETGAAGLAGIVQGAKASDVVSALGLGPESRVLLISTEGATDPEAYEAITGMSITASK